MRKEVYDAVLAEAGTVLSGITGAPTLREPNDASGLPSDRSMFIQLQFPRSNARQVSAGSPGNNVMREEGAFRFLICAPNSTGLADALEIAEALEDAFNHHEFDGVRCWTPMSPVLDDRGVDGGWYKVGVTVPYYFDWFA